MATATGKHPRYRRHDRLPLSSTGGPARAALKHCACRLLTTGSMVTLNDLPDDALQLIASYVHSEER